MTAVGADAERRVRVPLRPAMAWAVPRMFGYRMPPLPSVHRGLPSPYLTLVFSLSGELPIDIPEGERLRHGHFDIPVGGLHTKPVLLPQTPWTDGSRAGPQRGVQLAVHPLAARALFGLPAGEIFGEVLEFEDLVGAEGRVLRDRLTGQSSAASAVDLVTEWISRRLASAAPNRPSSDLDHAWQLIVGSAGRCRIADIAREVGWSRRHLTAHLRRETGFGAKDLARVSRFQRAKAMLVSCHPPLAEVAARCGYADQSHLTAEWHDFTGCTPGRWITDELPSLARLSDSE